MLPAVPDSAAHEESADFDLATLPPEETDRWEFKSGRTPTAALRDKLARAASGFWNSGGGTFVVGVGPGGLADGGVAARIGRQPVRDWVDQVLHEVAPVAGYRVHVVRDDPRAGAHLDAGHVLVAVRFAESRVAPHMAPDKRYYVRAGVHTSPAPHFLVEAIRARRTTQEPRIAHVLRLKPDDPSVVQLGVVALSDAPALSVEVTLHPLPALWKDASNPFPLRLPAIDVRHPFHMDLTTFAQAGERLGPDLRISVRYAGASGTPFRYDAPIEVASIAPWALGGDPGRKVVKALEDIARGLRRFERVEAHLARIARVAGPTGLRVSRSALADLAWAAGAGAAPSKLDPADCTWRAFVEVLGVDRKMAVRLERLLRFGRGRSLEELDGMTPDLAARVRACFEVREA